MFEHLRAVAVWWWFVAVGVIAAVWGLVDQIRHAGRPIWFWALIVLACFNVAQLLAAREARKAAELRLQDVELRRLEIETKLEQANKKLDALTKPDLRLELGLVGIAPNPNPKGLLLTLHDFSVTNSGAPSSASHWLIRLTFPDTGEQLQGQWKLMPRESVTLAGRAGTPDIFLRVSDFLPKLTQAPIRMGETVHGWFWAVFPGVTEEEILRRRPKGIVSFTDFVGRVYETPFPIGEEGLSR